MGDATPKRELPARERRQSFKVLESSPTSPNRPVVIPTPIPTAFTPTPSDSAPRVKRKYTRRAPLLRNSLDSRHSTPASEDSIPAKLLNSEPLHTTTEKPPSILSSAQYQSIAQSAVLAASLHRSRVQWLCDGIFKRYWTKPSKRKGIEAGADNPELKSMHKLGSCQITIEPHVFNAIVYTVRDTQVPPLPPFYRPPNPYPTNVATSPPFPSPNSASLPLVQPQQLNGSSRPPNVAPAHRSSMGGQLDGTDESIELNKDSNTVPQTPASALTAQSIPPKNQPPIPQARPAANPDPVIQKLAARAAADPHLKDLMKIVATSKASPDQLKEFQSHIDELNAIIRKEAEQERAQPRPTGPMSRVHDQPSQASATPPNLPLQPPALSASHPATYSSPIPMNGPGLVRPAGTPAVASPQYGYYPGARAEPFIKHVVLELTSQATNTQAASQNRWLFPEYAVLDTPPSGRGLEMVCSFFAERKGFQIIAAQGSPSTLTIPRQNKWKPEIDYYQPVTMVLHAPQHRTLQTIARAARPLKEVQEYMKGVIEKKTRAPVEYLRLQLPRAGDGDVDMTDFEDSAIDLAEDDELKDHYGVG